MITDELRAILTTTPAVSALVGERVYPGRRPQGSILPAVVYSVISRTRERDYGGSINLASSLVSYDCMSPTYAGSVEVSGEVWAALRDADPSGTLRGVFHSGDQDLIDETGAGTDAAVYRRVLTIEVFHDGE